MARITSGISMEWVLQAYNLHL